MPRQIAYECSCNLAKYIGETEVPGKFRIELEYDFESDTRIHQEANVTLSTQRCSDSVVIDTLHVAKMNAHDLRNILADWTFSSQLLHMPWLDAPNGRLGDVYLMSRGVFASFTAYRGIKHRRDEEPWLYLTISSERDLELEPFGCYFRSNQLDELAEQCLAALRGDLLEESPPEQAVNMDWSQLKAAPEAVGMLCSSGDRIVLDDFLDLNSLGLSNLQIPCLVKRVSGGLRIYFVDDIYLSTRLD